jgi:hypothetical protein
MRRPVVVKRLSARALKRRSAVSASAAARRAFPAWIDAGDPGIALSAGLVLPRVRDSLVLRVVSRGTGAKAKGGGHAGGAR